MQVIERFDDGTQSVLFDPGDRVVFIHDGHSRCKHPYKAGDRGVVVHREYNELCPTKGLLEVKLDRAGADTIEVSRVPPHHVDLESLGANTRRQNISGDCLTILLDTQRR